MFELLNLPEKVIAILGLIGFILDPFPCEIRTYETRDSPSGKLAAVVLEKDCGATTGYNRQIAIIESTETYSTTRDQTFFVVDGDPDLNLGGVDGFGKDEGECEGDEGAVVLDGFLAAQRSAARCV